MTDFDYIGYIDTDSLFIMLGSFLEKQGVDMDKWNNLSQPTRIKYLLELSKYIETDIDNRMYNETQCIDYGASVKREIFTIGFKQEIVCSAVIFISPKMYTFNVINDEGFDCDKVSSKGIEVVRSSSPKAFKVALKNIIERILKEDDDDTMIDIIENHKKGFLSSIPEDISINVSANNINKYCDSDYGYRKGTPYHVKGVANYHWLIHEFKLMDKYPLILEGDKCKFVYLKNNKYGIMSCTYYEWPEEFKDMGIEVDYDIMIEKYFINKAHILLHPINRRELLEGRTSMDAFF